MHETQDGLNDALIQKYGERTFMYTAYPNSRFWSGTMQDKEFREVMVQEFSSNPDIPYLLYIHIPHCHKQCLFCTCEVIIAEKYEEMQHYMTYLYKEIDILRRFFDKIGQRPNIREVHFGGGSPTYLKEKDFDILMATLRTIVDFDRVEECAIEIDPRHVKPGGMRYYAAQGINRISFGIQDFDRDVQHAVDRVQPSILTERLISPELRSLFSHGINFDIICGLPRQSVKTMRQTMYEIVRMAPDRICVNYMHFRPDIFAHQRRMPVFPDNRARKEIFRTARDILVSHGYIRLGYDHFAKPTDEVVRAMAHGEMKWNYLGTTAGRYEGTLGIGIHAVSMIGQSYYFQNVYASSGVKRNYDRYMSLLNERKLPIFHGHRMSEDDLLRRDAIQELRSYFYLDGEKLEKKYGIDFLNYFDREVCILKECVEDGIVEIHEKKIMITELGYEFADAVCSRFDTYI